MLGLVTAQAVRLLQFPTGGRSCFILFFKRVKMIKDYGKSVSNKI